MSRHVAKRGRGLVVLGCVAALLIAGLAYIALKPDAKFPELAQTVEARRIGKPVEIVSERTPTEAMWANPDGTFGREISSSPVRALVGKKWTKIDLTLERRADGTIRPNASATREVLSGGGSDPLLKTTMGGVQVVTTWPTKLPKPTIDGPSATYAEVYPGVDLRMSVTEAGTAQVLVVKDRAAAANPELQKIKLKMVAKGGGIRPADGGLSVIDAQGREVAVAPQPMMWDSSGDLKDERHRSAAAGSPDAIALRAVGPAQEDRVAKVRTTIKKDVVTLRPDAAMLGRDDAKFPIYIDPNTTPSIMSWAMVRQQSPNTEYYNWTTAAGQGAGNDGTYTQRLFWRFNVSSLQGATIDKATFTSRLQWTPSCSPHTIRLYRTGTIGSTTNWNNQPAWSALLDTEYDNAGHSGCNPYGKSLEFDATAGVVTATTPPNTNLTLGLRVLEESDTDTWYQFPRTASIYIKYSFPPDTPTSLSLSDPDVPCTSPAAVIGGVKPRLQAKLIDPDRDNVQAEFEVYAGSTITGTAIWSENSAPAGASDSTFVSAKRVQKSDGTLLNGLYTWRVRAVEQASQHLVGDWSAPCTFEVKDSLVARPGAILPVGANWSVGAAPVSVTLDPTFDVNATLPANFAYYGWSLNSNVPTTITTAPVTTDKRMNIAVAPTRAGTNILRVWAYNSAGSRSEASEFRFESSASAAFASQYRFDAGTGTTAIDSAGTLQPLTLGPTPATVWEKRGDYLTADTGTNAIDYQLKFTGSQAAPAVSTAAAVATNQSFTVSAWVDTADLTAARVAVSQGDATKSYFTLGIAPSCGSAPTYPCYRFGVRNSAGTWVYVNSTRAATQDVLPGLVQIVGDLSSTGVARLRVIDDGNIQETHTTAFAPFFNANTALLVGAAREASAYTAKWNGRIDDVMVMQGLLDDVALIQLHAGDGGRCYTTRFDGGLTACAN